MSDCIQNPARSPLLTFLKTPDLSMGFADPSNLALCSFSEDTRHVSALFLVVTADETEDVFNDLSDRLMERTDASITLLAVYHFAEYSILLVLDTDQQALSYLAEELSDYGWSLSFCTKLDRRSLDDLLRDKNSEFCSYSHLLNSLKLS